MPLSNMQRTRNRRGFRRELLPVPADYLRHLLGELAFNERGWARTNCLFHYDESASLSIHRDHGGFHCRVCGAKGGDLIDFEMRRSGFRFKAVCGALGAWQ